MKFIVFTAFLVCVWAAPSGDSAKLAIVKEQSLNFVERLRSYASAVAAENEHKSPMLNHILGCVENNVTVLADKITANVTSDAFSAEQLQGYLEESIQKIATESSKITAYAHDHPQEVNENVLNLASEGSNIVNESAKKLEEALAAGSGDAPASSKK